MAVVRIERCKNNWLIFLGKVQVGSRGTKRLAEDLKGQLDDELHDFSIDVRRKMGVTTLPPLTPRPEGELKYDGDTFRVEPEE